MQTEMQLTDAIDPRAKYYAGRSRFPGDAPPFNGDPKGPFQGKILRFVPDKDQLGEGDFVYHTPLMKDGKVDLVEITLPRAAALAAPNLPGKFAYPKFDDWFKTQGPKGLNGGTTHVNVVMAGDKEFDWPLNDAETRQLLEEKDVKAMAAEISKDTGHQVGYRVAQGRQIRYSAEDSRRVYDLVLDNGNIVPAWRAFRDRSTNGVGSPGKWALGVGLTWTPEAQDTGQTADEWPLPLDMSALQNYELIYAPPLGGMGTSHVVLRSKDAGITKADPATVDARLSAMEKLLAIIAQKVGVST